MQDTTIGQNTPPADAAKPAYMSVEEMPSVTPPPPTPSTTTTTPASTTTPLPTISSDSGGGSSDDGGRKQKTMIAGILGLVVLVAGIGAGVFALTRSQQLGPASAWDCEKYNFYVSRTGQTTAVNGSTRNEPIQKVEIKVDGVLTGTFDIPSLTPGQSANLGTVAVPTNQIFAWEATGTIDCHDGGSYAAEPSPTPSITASCSSIKAFDDQWNPLTSTQLSALKAGGKVRFTALGTTSSGSVDKVRFTINQTTRAEVTTKRPGTDEFYDEYTIPTGVTTFNVSAQVHHLELNTWF